MNKESLVLQLNKLGVSDQSKIDRLEDFMMATLDANKSFNLTAIKDEEKFRELMILDSAYVLKYGNFENKKVIDIGTGAGFPGMVLATLSNGEFTLLDSTKKKVDFYSNYSAKNGYSNVIPVYNRAEEYAKNHREQYDFAIARAVSELNILLELVLPLLKVNGIFIAMKGSKGLEELEKSQNALKKLGAVVEQIDEYYLPESNEKRINIIIKKIERTSRSYPREYKDIVKKPL